MYERTISSETVFDGRIMRVDVLEVELETGRRAHREIVRHGEAVAVIARLSDGRFVFIRQFRKPIDRICFEIVAGNCDHEEDMAMTAARELEEETGYVASSIVQLGSIHPCVGYSTERIGIFFATIDGEQGDTNFDHDERIETVIVTEEQMDEDIRNDRVDDGKTLAAWMLYKTKKAGL